MFACGNHYSDLYGDAVVSRLSHSQTEGVAPKTACLLPSVRSRFVSTFFVIWAQVLHSTRHLGGLLLDLVVFNFRPLWISEWHSELRFYEWTMPETAYTFFSLFCFHLFGMPCAGVRGENATPAYNRDYHITPFMPSTERKQHLVPTAVVR